MSFLLITLCVLSSVVQSVFKKQFNLHYTGGNYFFSALLSLVALLFFVLSAQHIVIRAEILPYSFAFALAYATTSVSGFIAIKCGPLAITSLIGSYSLIIPTMHGILFLEEPFGIIKCIGIVFLLISLFLIRTNSNQTSMPRMSLKWLICVVLSLFSNGMCSVIQNAQRHRFSGTENSNFMILALSLCVCILLLLSFLFERKHILPVLKKGSVWAAACGLSNGLLNLLVMIVTASVASSVFFPVHSAGCLVLISVVSILFYKERFIPRQYVGLGCGLAAVILLNIL